MDIKLGSGIKQLSIEGKPYTIDLYDLDTVSALDNFIARRDNGELSVDDELLKDCKELIDISLGQGSYDSIFGDERSIRPLKLIAQLKELFVDEASKTELAELEEKQKAQFEEIKEATQVLKDWNKQVQYTQNMYGNVANKRRTSKPNRNKR